MTLLTAEDIQAALNIDLTDSSSQTLTTFRIASAVAYAEGSPGRSLDDQT